MHIGAMLQEDMHHVQMSILRRLVQWSPVTVVPSISIRAAFEKNGLSLDSFKTVHGIGYIFEPDKPAV